MKKKNKNGHHPLLNEKKVGLLLPLFSMRSQKDWGIGDIVSMKGWLGVLKKGGFKILEILPVNEMPPGTNCPYTSLSGFAIDPVYIAPEALPETMTSSLALEFMKSRYFLSELKRIRGAKILLYDDIRKLKYETLWRVYKDFSSSNAAKPAREWRDFVNYCVKNAYWLQDYSVFRRLKDVYGWASWTSWPKELRERKTKALREFRIKNSFEINFFKYLQWCVSRQWTEMKKEASEKEISLFGDLPFMVNKESSDIWARPEEFDISVSIGAPPDTWTPAGQKWGLPAHLWKKAGKNKFEWWRLRIKKAEDFYDIYRVDHMVGFFRTWIVPENGGLPHFDIEGEKKHEDRGRRFLKTITAHSRMLAVGEDLGLIPPFVGKVLCETRVPGYKVLRWEKNGEEYTDMKDYDPVSLATTATHDTETLAGWWKSAGLKERNLFWKMVAGGGKAPSFKKALDPILEKMIKSGSHLVIIPYSDFFGLDYRINTPNSMGPHNWSLRPDAPLEEFASRHAARLAKISKWIKEASK